MTVPDLGTPGLAGSGEHAPPAAGRRDRIRTALVDLFPEPSGPEPRTGLMRWAFFGLQIVVIALGAAVMLVRIGGRPAWESVYAEDPGIYLPAALAHPWHLLESYGGYLQLVPRVIGQAAALVPIKHASAVFAIGGALVASACGLFAYHASAGQVGSRWLRALIGLSVVLLPVAQLEIADNGVNSIWYLLTALFWAALWRPRTRAGLAAAAVVAFAAAASSSLGLLFAPLFAARLFVLPRRPGEQAATIGWGAGCLLQIGVILTSHVSRLTPHNPLNAVLYYAHEVLLPALGWHLSWDLRHAVGLTVATVIMGVLILGVLAYVVVTEPGRCRVFVLAAVAVGLLFTAFTSAFAWGGPTQRIMVSVTVEHGARYATVPILLLDAALIVAADAYARRWWPHRRAIAAVAVLVAVLAAGWATDFRYPVRRFAGISSSWAHRADRWLRYCTKRPDGTITVSFHDWWGTAPLSSTFNCTSLHR